jgi:hypothetical protein
MFAGLGWLELDVLFNPNAMMSDIDGSAYKCIELTDEGYEYEYRRVEDGQGMSYYFFG